MNVMMLYNHYRHRVHGEEAVVESTVRLLRESGVSVSLFTRSSEGLEHQSAQKLLAGLAGIYNPMAAHDLRQAILREQPDVIHAHNLYPWISPAALVAATRRGVPVVMTVHHHGLTCPAITHYRNGQICVECIGGHEFNCVRHNCRNSLIESSVYALRSAVARRFRLFLDHISTFIALNEFSKNQLIASGFPSDKIVVRPNMVFSSNVLRSEGEGDYIGYVGRITAVKGVDLLLEQACNAGLPVRVAGDPSGWPELHARYQDRVRFEGVLHGEQLLSFYRNARFIVVPSRWWEVCPIVVLEAMNYGCPVIASKVGGLPELVQHDVTGLLFEPDNAADLTAKMQTLWMDSELRARLRAQARKVFLERYSERPYLADLMKIYQQTASVANGMLTHEAL